MNTYKLTTPLKEDDIIKLRAGDIVLISGKIYTARDAAHKRLIEAINRGDELPFPIEGSVIYYVGPTPPPPNRAIGSAGPTTSYRMDPYAPILYKLGLKASIGKGKRSEEVKKAMQEYKGVYLGATGGAGALLSQRIKEARIIAHEDLGPEAIRELIVEDFPTLVINDVYGGELYVKPKL
jgi:fumarate hydratase subunit beta